MGRICHAGKKLLNVNILDIMQRIVDRNTKHYKTDFAYDVETIKDAVLKPDLADRTFIWLCRESGTWLLRERDVFIQGTRENNTFQFYAEQTDDVILAYVIEANTINGSTGFGDIYGLDYKDYYNRVKTSAVPAGSIVLHYERGQRIQPSSQHFGFYPDKEFGMFERYEFMPESQEQLEIVLKKEKMRRSRFGDNYKILYYEIYECPQIPTEEGKYFGKAQIEEQAESIVRNAKARGKRLFIKAVCSDGKKRYFY